MQDQDLVFQDVLDEAFRAIIKINQRVDIDWLQPLNGD